MSQEQEEREDMAEKELTEEIKLNFLNEKRCKYIIFNI
jgi:hypothetical protein